jgi:serine/threonine-protein kinase
MIQKIGKYQVLERIGRGGMGTVFKAHDPVLDRSVALKVISPDIEVTDALRTRFFREAQACARLNHRNIITVYDLAEGDGHLFIVMELLEGEELKAIIGQRKPLSLEAKLGIMIQVCDGLAYAHQRGIVHRDIKPGNIFVLRDGSVKIVDFGIARIIDSDSDLTRKGLVMGTLRYMAPEQAQGIVDQRCDVFSVGAVFYELLVYRQALPRRRSDADPRGAAIPPTPAAPRGRSGDSRRAGAAGCRRSDA